jgi:hypothetical protein
MRKLIGVLALAAAPTLAAAAEKPDWAFPVTEKVQPPPRFEAGRVRPAPPGSTLSITRAKADDMYDIPNWYPSSALPATSRNISHLPGHVTRFSLCFRPFWRIILTHRATS